MLTSRGWLRPQFAWISWTSQSKMWPFYVSNQNLRYEDLFIFVGMVTFVSEGNTIPFISSHEILSKSNCTIQAQLHFKYFLNRLHPLIFLYIHIFSTSQNNNYCSFREYCTNYILVKTRPWCLLFYSISR